MSEIVLGCEIEDVTVRVRGISVAYVERLDGSKSWLLQPPYEDNGNSIPIVEVQDAYAVRVSDGVRDTTYWESLRAVAMIGFHARDNTGI